jgi:amino acid permease
MTTRGLPRDVRREFFRTTRSVRPSVRPSKGAVINAKKAPEALNEDGLAQGLGKRQIRMIAIGGAIGVGLFLGSGKGIFFAGPALIAVYAITGVFIFIIARPGRIIDVLAGHRQFCRVRP